MKWVLILINVAAAAGVVFAGNVVRAIHRAHSYSVYSELVKREAITDKVRPAPGDPVDDEGHFDIAKRLETIGGLDEHLPILCFGAAAVFLLNAVALMALGRKNPTATVSPS